VLPLLGPSSIRDGIGDYGDSFSSVIGRIYPVDTRNQTYVTKMLGKRAALLAEENVIDEASIDQYAFMRDAYLQHRQSMVYDGNPPREKFDDDEEDSKADKNPPPPIKESALPATPAPLPDNSNFSAPNSGPSTPQ
jgi:phospholipid-binding lipoprotein MlaA